MRWLWGQHGRRRELSIFVNTWLAWGDVRPSLRLMMNGISEARLGGSPYFGGLFSALSLQLLFMIAGADSLAICSACSKPYTPKRKPQGPRGSASVPVAVSRAHGD